MVEPILSILIPTLVGREEMLDNLIFKTLKSQCDFEIGLIGGYSGRDVLPVEIFWNTDAGETTTGGKRNQLLQWANGKYVVFVDDDDDVMPYYIEEILKAAEQDCDCIGMCGIMTTNGGNEIGWELSKDFKNDTVIRNGRSFYTRTTNHISPVKRELALKAMFPEISNGEDKGYSEA